jgi:hypothetical protein
LCHCAGWKLKLLRASGAKRAVEMKGNIKGVITESHRRSGFRMQLSASLGRAEALSSVCLNQFSRGADQVEGERLCESVGKYSELRLLSLPRRSLS